MSLTTPSIRHFNSVAHDGKVVVFGTDKDRQIWYAVKRSGFEIKALEEGQDPFGFEDWRKLPLDLSEMDSSVSDYEDKNLTDRQHQLLLRSRYGRGDDVTKTVYAPVQPLSVLGHLYVFRQTPNGKIVVNRFVLDSMAGLLIPKLEVRYRRSRKRFEPSQGMKMSGGELKDVDARDYRDMDGNSFYEPATELSFIPPAFDGGFSVVLVPTSEHDGHRWHVFAWERDTRKLVLWSVGASEDGLFNVRDRLFADSNGDDKVYREVSGIVRRELVLSGLTVAQGPAATAYDTQVEKLIHEAEGGRPATKQLMRQATYVMLAVPVKASGSHVVTTAAINFSVGVDGLLSQVDKSPVRRTLRSTERDVILPLDTLDEIKELVDTTPPPAGVISGIERGTEDLLQINSKESLQGKLDLDSTIKISDTKSYDGHYKVVAVNGSSFEVDARFNSNKIGHEIGNWEVVEEEETGLVYEDMVVGYRKSASDRLEVVCASHDLKVGDEVQISGLRDYDGVYPVKVAADALTDRSFVLDTPYFPADAANLSTFQRRGTHFDLNDHLETPSLELAPAVESKPFGITLEAWVRVDSYDTSDPTAAPSGVLVRADDGHLELAFDRGATLRVGTTDGSTAATFTVTDPVGFPDPTVFMMGPFDPGEDPTGPHLHVDQWIHLAGVVSYTPGAGGGVLRCMLFRNGKQVQSREQNGVRPVCWSTSSVCHIGEHHRGLLSEVRIWQKARTDVEIKDSMYPPLTGQEDGLAVYYRLGAIVHGDADEPSTVPDFSVHGRDATVHGNPSAGARWLSRSISISDTTRNVVRYRNDSFVAVTQRATYEESFELEIDALGAGESAGDVDGRGTGIFEFAYWGKASRGSDEIISISGTPTSFEDLRNGWYRASCEVTIPDGVSLLRTFGLDQVSGGWTRLGVRKHRLRLKSDAVTREDYRDEITLAAKSGGSSEDTLDQVRSAERVAAWQWQRVHDLEERLAVIRDNAKYTAERDLLRDTLIPQLEQAERDKKQALVQHRDNFKSYYCHIQGQRGYMLQPYGGSSQEDTEVVVYQELDVAYQLWSVVELDGNNKIVNKGSGKCLSVRDGSSDHGARVTIESFTGSPPQHWLLIHDGVQGGLDVFAIQPSYTSKQLNVWGGDAGNNTEVKLHRPEHTSNMKWVFVKAGMTPEAQSLEDALEQEIQNLEAQLEIKRTRLARLNGILSSGDSEEFLNTWLSTAKNDLSAAETTVSSSSSTFLGNLSPAHAQAMDEVATDDRDLTTHGARLDFVRPYGRIRAADTCEGNVQLSYFDDRGRMRLTLYDAAADSRNSTFEQWIPDSLRACVYPVSHDAAGHRNATVRLNEKVPLAENAWTFESWFYYPLAAKSDGSVYEANYFAGLHDHVHDSPLVVVGGDRLGTLVEGQHLGGVSLRQLTTGWHHAAAVGRNDGTEIYLDGKKVSSVSLQRSILSFDGSGNDYVELPVMPLDFSRGLTIEAWVWFDRFSEHSPIVTLGDQDRANERVALGATRDGHPQFQVRGENLIAQQTSVVPGRWAHVAATYDTTRKVATLYLNGRVAQTMTGTSQRGMAGSRDFNGNWLAHMGSGAGAGESLHGQLAEVRLWQRPLAEFEIEEGMQRDSEGSENDLVGYWPMKVTSSGDDQQVKDKSSSAHHGTVHGEPGSRTLISQVRGNLTVLGNSADHGSPLGKMAEARIWKTALSEAEIAVNAQVLLTGNEPELAGYWPMSEGTGGSVHDLCEASNHGQLDGYGWTAFTAEIGKPATGVMYFNASGGSPGYVEVRGDAAFYPPRFTLSLYAQVTGSGHWQSAVDYNDSSNRGFYLALDEHDHWHCRIGALVLEGPPAKLGQWTHLALTHDGSTARLYVDGQEVATQNGPCTPRSLPMLSIGGIGTGLNVEGAFNGAIAEVGLWSFAASAEEVGGGTLRHRLTGHEYGLIACWPLSTVTDQDKTPGLGPHGKPGTVHGTAIRQGNDLPVVVADHLTSAEYSTVEVDAAGNKLAMMRRFLGYAASGEAKFLPEARIEELALQWAGNAQFKPTLLGYIEGPPPVPSENLTVEDDYNGATSVALTESEGVEFNWERTEATTRGVDLEGFLGAAWQVEAGLGIVSKISEGQVGAQFFYNHSEDSSRSSAVSAASALAMTDALELRCMAEDSPRFPQLGIRHLPKNVGYALVISGLADVFVTKLRRSGRAVGQEVRPVEGIPLDVNTITFMINPAYTMNGSLDGLVGSKAADEVFYPQVPEMRAHYGSLYPASYYRLKQAYDLQNQIDQFDKERQAYYDNYDVTNTDLSQIPDASEVESFGQVHVDAAGSGGTASDGDGRDRDEVDKERSERLRQQLASEKESANTKATERKKEIDSKIARLKSKVRASSALEAWQERMENLQIRAGKRNIVNTYVWDADGGLRTESQSFANTVEHSVSGGVTDEGGGGASTDTQISAFKFELSLLGRGASTTEAGKAQTHDKSFEIEVDLQGVESKGVTDLDDLPLMPGEKVDRYRFKTFYLEGSTDHFHDFFNEVVDPEWLMSNDEEARALRQTQASDPNKCWRVLHRVTYVERPALMSVGRDLRSLPVAGDAESGTERALSDLGNRLTSLGDHLTALDLGTRLTSLETQLQQILTAPGTSASSAGLGGSPSSGEGGGDSGGASLPVDGGGGDGNGDPLLPGDGGRLININQAAIEVLALLPGIDMGVAQMIVDQRQSVPFTAVDELEGIIGFDVLAGFRDLVTV